MNRPDIQLLIVGSDFPCEVGKTYIGIHQDSGATVAFRVMRESTYEEFREQKVRDGRLTPEMDARASAWGFFYAVSVD